MTVPSPLNPSPTESQPIFARHETFHPRFGWLKKGFDRATTDSKVFERDDAPVRLGVGKNMVRSIRYWCHAFKLLAADQPTEFGQQLLGEQGWDTYLEDPASLWLLHWMLLEPPCTATTWEFTFNRVNAVEFTVESLMKELRIYRDRQSPRTADSSLKKDVSCLLRMYSSQPAKSLASEDSLDCPFTQLGLIQATGETNAYAFRVGYKPTLPAAVIVYACLQYAARTVDSHSIPLAKLLYDEGSPGMVFKLTESVLWGAIDTIRSTVKSLGVSDAVGTLQFCFEDEPRSLATNILNHYYKGATGA
ncbi:MAG: DUF4007 family protein [Cyanobacteria bacterium]|nr:DUF4007 family protein [Cyanobacteriota bacterium]MDW8200564.1 DUF4007 family protein [Cyanobacteriota bacterium SKYGB_h_bin112]